MMYLGDKPIRQEGGEGGEGCSNLINVDFSMNANQFFCWFCLAKAL